MASARNAACGCSIRWSWRFEELESSATEDEIAAERAVAKTTNVVAFTRKRPARQPFPEHLPRERVVEPGPTVCQCCGSPRLRKLGEDITETLEVIPRQWKVIQHVREKFTCRDCEKISQAPAPFHVLARGWAGPSLLAMILFEKFGQHQPLNRQAERYAREGVPLSLSTLADQVGGCCAVLAPLIRRIERHVFAAERLHGDDTTVPVLAKGKTDTGRCWVYVRDDRPFGGPAPPAAMFYYSRDRGGEHPQAHLADYAGIFQADAFGGYNKLYEADRKPGPIVEAACWVHARRPFFVMADVAANARRKAQGKTPAVISPLALEAVRRIDALFEIERSINGQSAERRRAVRQELSAPLVADLERWLREQRRQALARQRSRQGDGLHAQALAGVHPVPRRRPDLPLEQCRRTSAARHCPRQKIMAVRGFRPRRPARRGDVQPDRHRQIERCRPASLAGRRPGPDRRASRPQDRRTAAVELAAAFGTAKPGGLIVAAIAAVFTIGYVANLLGEDEDWLHDLVDRHVPRRRLPLGLRRRRGWRDRLHQVRHRVPAADHRRRKSRRPRTATGQTDRIAQPAVLTAWRRRVLARATMRRRRMVAIEFGMWRSGRIGGASGSVTAGNGRSRERRGERWS